MLRFVSACVVLLVASRGQLVSATVTTFAQQVVFERAPWLDELISRLDPESEPARRAAALGGAASDEDRIEAIAGYFRSRPAPARLWAIPRPEARDPEFSDPRADKALNHLITDREGEEQYGELLPWYAGDKKIVTLSRFPHFDYLSVAYFHTGDERYAAAMARDMSDFIANVPIERAEGYHVQMDLRVNPWNWVLLQWRVKRWIDALYYMTDSPSLSDEQYLRALLHMQREIEWMIPRKVLGLHNGTLGNLSAIIYTARSFPEFERSSTWLQDATAFYAAFLDTAFYPGEFLVELTVGYSEGTLQLCLDMFDSLPDSPVRTEVAGKLERLVDAHVGIMKPNRSLPRYGDHGVYDIRDRLLRKAARLFDRPDLRVLADRSDIPADVRTPTSFPPQSNPYYLSGYYALRDGWGEDANYLSMDAGPFGTNHHHGDKLSITVAADGAEFIVDPGTPLYRSIEPGPRIDARPGYMHNVLTVDGADVNAGWDRHYAFDVLENRWVTNPTYDFLEGVYEYRVNLVDAIWRRSVLFRKGEYWIVIDALLGEGVHDVESNMQFMVGTELQPAASVVPGENEMIRETVATAPNGASLSLQRLSTSLMHRDIVVGDTIPQPSTFLFQYPTFIDWTRGGRGWVGTFGNESPYVSTQSHPAPALLFSGSVPLPHFDVNVITPLSNGMLKSPSVSWLGDGPGGGDVEQPGSGALAVQIEHDDGTVDVLEWAAADWQNPRRPLPKDEGYWYRTKDGHITEVMLLNVADVAIDASGESIRLSFGSQFEGVARRSPDGRWSVFADSILRGSALPELVRFEVTDATGTTSLTMPVDRAGQKAGEWIQLVEQ